MNGKLHIPVDFGAIILSYLLTFLTLLSVVVSTAISGDSSSFKITTKRDSDRVEIKTDKNRILFSIYSPFGISNITIKRKEEGWPETVTLRLHLKGLESFQVSNGKTTLNASVSSQDGKIRQWKDNQEDLLLDEKSPYWTTIQMIDVDGKLTKKIPLKGAISKCNCPEHSLKTIQKTSPQAGSTFIEIDEESIQNSSKAV